MKKRIYISVPRDQNLDERQRRLKHAVLNRLRDEGMEPQEFQVSGLPRRSPYTFEAVRDIMQRCHGVLILAFARWHDVRHGEGLAIPTVWNHFEGAFAVALRKELLVITEEHVAQDGITWGGGGQIVVSAPLDAEPDWLESSYPDGQIGHWVEAVRETRDVFLAFSSGARTTALDVDRFLSDEGIDVKNWEFDFAAGPTIFSELQQATSSCIAGVMLLTKDDAIGDGEQAAPRDNVIFEMGMFMEAKGRDRVLVIREQGAKLPADVGGGIYLSLKDRGDIRPIHTELRNFATKRI